MSFKSDDFHRTNKHFRPDRKFRKKNRHPKTTCFPNIRQEIRWAPKNENSASISRCQQEKFGKYFQCWLEKIGKYFPMPSRKIRQVFPDAGKKIRQVFLTKKTCRISGLDDWLTGWMAAWFVVWLGSTCSRFCPLA